MGYTKGMRVSKKLVLPLLIVLLSSRLFATADDSIESGGLSQALALAIGLIVVFACSFLIGDVPGNFLEITQRTLQLYVGPIFLLFFLSLFVPFSTPWGVIAGSLSSILTDASVAYWASLNEMFLALKWTTPSEWTGIVNFSFQWILPSSLLLGLMVGCLVSLITRRDRSGLIS